MLRKNLTLLAFAFAFAFGAGAAAFPVAAAGCNPHGVLACEAALRNCVRTGGDPAGCCSGYERCMTDNQCEPVSCEV
ncbi:hypothetical protein SAMN04487939_102263 [Lysobacter sp. yr284]|uniref:hypothetical protein n=1 Tax=Lysobacter sp. yr284 TaxID=1761791 RepID=UPI00089A9EED|nr:hypothetical protein [Lysobacter sp. yr284]SDY46490.1 hypothetical protein SAMN04487939_102263 [Lysobacter sp. yr284]